MEEDDDNENEEFHDVEEEERGDHINNEEHFDAEDEHHGEEDEHHGEERDYNDEELEDEELEYEEENDFDLFENPIVGNILNNFLDSINNVLFNNNNNHQSETETTSSSSPIASTVPQISAHPYLGELPSLPIPKINEDDDREKENNDEVLKLPMIFINSVIVFPGESLPLRIEANHEDGKNIQYSIKNCSALIGLAKNRIKAGSTGVILKIISLSGGEDGSEMRLLTNVIDRFSFNSELPRYMNDVSLYRVSILHDPMNDSYRYNSYSNLQKSMLTPLPIFIYEKYDLKVLGEKALKLFRTTCELQDNEGLWKRTPCDIENLSYFIASSIVGSNKQKRELLEMNSTYERLVSIINYFNTHHLIACSNCNSTIAKQSDIIYLEGSNGTCSSYVNPHGHIHQTLTVSNVQNVQLDFALPSTDSSWFTGYAWTIICCASCFHHIGWKFTPGDLRGFATLRPTSFFGIARSQICLI